MVFGWGKKKEPRMEEIRSIMETRFSDVSQILSGLEEVRSNAIISEARSFRDRTVPRMDYLLRIAHNLEKDDLKTGDVDRRLRSMVTRGKRQVIHIIKAEARRAVVSVDTVEDVRTIASDIAQPIKRIGDALGRHSKVIHIFAKKQAGKLKSTLSALSSDRDEFFKSIKNFDTFRDSANEIRAMLDRIAGGESEVEAKEGRIAQMRQSIERLELEAQEKKRSMEVTTSSHEYELYVQARSELEQAQQEKAVIRQQVEAQFTKISRPLSKYFYVSSLDKDLVSFLERLVADPLDAIGSRPKDDTIKVLMAVRKGILSGSVSVKDQIKSVSQIDDTVEMLAHFLGMISDHAGKCRTLEDRMNLFDIAGLEREKGDLVRNRKEMEECKIRIKSLKSEIRDLTGQRKELVSKIEFVLNSISPTRYTVRDD